VLCFLAYADGDIVIEALMKDKRVALEAFGSYVEVAEFNLQNH
jgi:hypothetical protein